MGKYHEITLQTKQNFVDAFWGLYCEKRIAKITVKDITTKAGYNRSTFYEYFKDAYDVLEYLEQSLIPTLELLPPLNTPLGKLGMSMDLFMKLYEQNAKYYSILLGEKGDPAFASKLKKAIHSMLVSELAVHKSVDTNKLDYILEYTLTSMIGLMSYWFNKNGPMPKEQLYDLIRQLMEEGVVKQFQQNMEENTSIQSVKEVSSESAIESTSPPIEIITVEEKDPFKIKLDKHGYFVIIPKSSDNTIFVEHYSSNDQLLNMIKGENARNIYLTIIENGWVSEMGHAAYLGKELTKAEMSMKLGFKYIQDKA